jgi:hypothetical protein
VEQGDVHKGQVKGLCCAWCGIESPIRHGIALVSTLSALSGRFVVLPACCACVAV